MSVLVECPACESRFELSNLSGEPESGCPACHFAFDAVSHVCDKGKPTFEINKQNGLPEIPEPRCLEEFARRKSDQLAPPPLAPPKLRPPAVPQERTKAPATSRLAVAGLPNNQVKGWDANEWDADATDIDLDHPTIHAQPFEGMRAAPADAKGMPSLVSVAIGILLCLISVGSLAGIIYLLSSNSADKQSTADSQDESASTDAELASDEGLGSQQVSIANGAVADAELTTDGKSADSINSVNPIKTGNRIYDRIWEKNAAYILQFDLSSGLDAPKSMMGLAIDRRGWVLTNMQELRKQPAAQMWRLHAPAWNQPIEFSPLSPAESLTAAVPDFDLCVLQLPAGSVPQTEVVVDEHFEFESDVMLYAIAPSAESVTKPFVKCRIFNRQPQANVPLAVQTQLRDRGFKIGDQFRWILHDGQLKANSSPCPLFSETGELVAIHLLYDDQSKAGYAIPARIVMDLRNGTVGDVELVADVPAVQELAAQFSGEKSVTVAKVALSSDFPAFRKGDFTIIDRAKEQFELCDSATVDWLAKTAGEYRQLQSFANLLAALDETAVDETIDRDRRTIFETEADTLYDKISTVDWPTMKQIEQQNQFAVAGLESPGQPFFAYVEVERPVGMVNIGSQPVALCTIIGTEKTIVVPITRTAGDVSIKSQWLLIGRDDPDQKVEAPGLKQAFISLIRARRLIAEPR